MEIPMLELDNETSKNRNYSIESIFGKPLDFKHSALSFQYCSSEGIRSTESAEEFENYGTFECVSTPHLSDGRSKIITSASKGEVYFQKINASVVFSEDYKCRIGKRKSKIDCELYNIFGENEKQYCKLIAEAKKKQRCGSCLLRDECSCENGYSPSMIQARNYVKAKVEKVAKVEKPRIKPYVKKPHKIKLKIEPDIEAPVPKLVKRELFSEKKVHKEIDSPEQQNSLVADQERRDSITVTRERNIIKQENPNSDNIIDELPISPQDSDNTRVTMSSAVAEIIPEVISASKLEAIPINKPATKSAMKSATKSEIKDKPSVLTTKTKPRTPRTRCCKKQIPCICLSIDKLHKNKKKVSGRCNGCNISRANYRKLMQDAACCTPSRGLREVGTITRSKTIYCKCTQTHFEGVWQLADYHKPRVSNETIALDPINELDTVESDKAQLLIFIENLIEEFEQQYKEETKKCKKKKKRNCSCNNTEFQPRKDKCKRNYMLAYTTMTEQYMQYVPILSAKKNYVKSTTANERSRECDQYNHQNKNLLKFLSVKRKQFSCFGANLIENFKLTQDDVMRFGKEFNYFLVRNKTI